MSSVNYSIGTADKYDALPLLPAIGTMNGGIRLNSDISMAVGAKVEFDGLKFNESVWSDSASTPGRLLVDSLDAISPRFSTFFNLVSSTLMVSVGSSVGWTPNPFYASTVYQQLDVVSSNAVGNLGTFLVRGTNVAFARAISRQFRVRDAVGSVVYKWLDQVSDYKSTPPDASVVGSLQWYKLATNGNEINNLLTGTLLHNELTTNPPTQPVTVYVLDRDEDVSMVQSSYNWQPVTISYEFAGGGLSTSFDFGFNFNF
jgi:hypothetical protein